RALSPLRDAQSVLDAYDALMARFDGEVERRTFAGVRRRLTLRKSRRAQEVTDLAQRLAHVRDLMEAARERVATWPVHATGGGARGRGLELPYRRARKAMAVAYEARTEERFHEWRKGVKYHWYHSRILQPLWDTELAARAGAGNALGEMLGSHHDLGVLHATLLDKAEGFGRGGPVTALVELIDRRRAQLQGGAPPLAGALLGGQGRRVGA